jgi:hypothetical protein
MEPLEIAGLAFAVFATVDVVSRLWPWPWSR